MNVERERRRQEASPCGPVECKQTVCQNIEGVIKVGGYIGSPPNKGVDTATA